MFDRIKEIREKFITQQQMANALNVRKQAVSDYERGINIIPTKALIILIRDYNVNINWLLTGQGNMLLSDDDKVNSNELIKQLQGKINQLEIENKLLKELVKK